MLFDFGKTRVSVTFSFAAVVTLMLLLCEQEIVLVSLFSSLFHECGHLFFMLLFSAEPSLVAFGAFGIRIERGSGRFLSYGKEALIALGGVLANTIAVASGLAVYCFSGKLWGAKLFAVNGFIALFNLLPVRQLDFGRSLECMLSYKLKGDIVQKALTFVSESTVLILVALCVIYNIFVKFNVSLIAVTVYLVIISFFKESYND